MRKAKQGNVERITYTRATGLLIQRQRKVKKVRSSWYGPASCSHTRRSGLSDSEAPDIRTRAGETHHFCLPMRNFFFMKTIYFMGTQTSRAVEVT